MRNRRRALSLTLCGVISAACGAEPPSAPVYQAVPVERREIVVSAEAAGVIEPYVTVEVKSKASGEILEVLADSGDRVERGALLLQIDQRQLRNTLAQAKADLEVARARLANAKAQLRRSEKLYQAQSISETSYDQAVLDHATARAEVVRSEAAVENAQIEMDDADVLAPIDGTILRRDVERGQVISSPTRDVAGGTVLLTMAALERVRVRTLVDETDIGKIRPGLAATVTVSAYSDRPFHGSVLKIEPQSEIEQNVTMFPTLVGLDNPEGLLKPGMNCEVEIHVDRRDGVLAIPNAALRTPRDVASAAEVLGLSPDEVREALAATRDSPSRAGSGQADTAPGTPPQRARQLPSGRRVHRLHLDRRRARGALDPHRPHRPGLHRGAGGALRVRFGPDPSQRWPGELPAAIPGSHPTRHRRRTARREEIELVRWVAVETVGVAFQSIRAGKLRAGLTMLGIIIGVAAVIAMVALGTGAQRAIDERIAALGSNLLSIYPGQYHVRGVASDLGAPLTTDDARALSRDAPLISEVVPEMQQLVPARVRRGEPQRQCAGNHPELRRGAQLPGRVRPHVQRRGQRGPKAHRRARLRAARRCWAPAGRP